MARDIAQGLEVFLESAAQSPGSPCLVLAIDLHQAVDWTRDPQSSFSTLMFLIL